MTDTPRETLIDLVKSFCKKCMDNARPLPKKIVNSMTNGEFNDLRSWCLEVIIAGPQIALDAQLNISDIFAGAAIRTKMDKSLALYVPVEKTTASTAREFENMGAPDLAKVVAKARTLKGLDT